MLITPLVSVASRKLGILGFERIGKLAFPKLGRLGKLGFLRFGVPGIMKERLTNLGISRF